MENRGTRKPTLYLETTIVSYLAARPSRDILVLSRQQLTRLWWDEQRSRFRVFVSPAVVEEAEAGDRDAAAERLRLLEEVALLPPTPQVEAMADVVRKALHIPQRAYGDSFHLAFAIHYEMDYLLTWNCAHLANAMNLRLLADLSRREGLWLPIICTPEEMVEWKEES